MTRKNTLHGKLLNGDVLNLSVDVIKDMLKLDSASNAEYSDKTIIYHLLNACTSQTSVNQVSNICINGPSEGTIRYRLRNLNLEDVEQTLNEKLKYNVLKTVSRKLQSFAIDFVNIPFYGEEENNGDTIKTKPRQGTSRFYAYASIYLILRNKRYTLAVKYIRDGESLKDIIDFLIKEVESAGFRIKGLYLDREFYTVDVISYLQERETPFIMPCVKRGRSGGIRSLFVGRKSYSTEYTMRSGDREATFTTILWLSTLKTNTNAKESNISLTPCMVWTFLSIKSLRSIESVLA